MCGLLLVALIALSGCSQPGLGEPLRIVVMDPLSARLACDCVGGYAQRRYDRLGDSLAKTLGRPVTLAYAETLRSPAARVKDGVDLVIGKFSVVRYDAGRIALPVRPIAMLTDKEGNVTQTGLFVVRAADRAKGLTDLAGRKVLFGPADSDETRAAALATLDAFGQPVAGKPDVSPDSKTAALAVVRKSAAAAVISSYALPLLEGCGDIDKGTLRVVERTDPVPFIGVFATDRLDAKAAAAVLDALLAAGKDKDLLKAMESADGFVSLGPPLAGWPDWRGPGRDAQSPHVPETLTRPRLLWSRMGTGPGVAGLAVHDGRLIMPDKGTEDEMDIWRCLDANTGREIWTLAYKAAGEMAYTNTPRAHPVVHEGRAYLLGAFGHLHCVRFSDGKVLWKKDLIKDFGAKLPTWGFCAAPLVVDDKVIVMPGADAASTVALDSETGKVRWQSPGDLPGYGNFILATLGGVRQIIGHDRTTLAGWDPESGKRLWTVEPLEEGDYNVPTPIVVGEKLLVATENNGTRLYEFDTAGRIVTKPVVRSDDLVPDTSSPVVANGMVFGSCEELVCLDLQAGLKTLWIEDSKPFRVYCSFIAGNGRVLAMSLNGTLHLLKAERGVKMKLVSSVDLFPGVVKEERKTWSHPTLVDGRLYVRNFLGVYCFLLE